jgi:hypothetical protein
MVKGLPEPLMVTLTGTVSPAWTVEGMLPTLIWGRRSMPVRNIRLPYSRPTAVFCASPSDWKVWEAT